MLETFPGLLLVIMIAITLILLPRLNDDRASDRTRRTEEIYTKKQREQ